VTAACRTRRASSPADRRPASRRRLSPLPCRPPSPQGFASALDPEVNVMDAAAPVLLAYSLTGRAFGRLYS
jgi:hypothetical protein